MIVVMGDRSMGILMEPDGHHTLSFIWGLEMGTNNEVKRISFFKGLNLLSKITSSNIMMVGDSSLIINTP
jgi:hypothetical protein